MHLIALTRWNPASRIEDELPHLAPRMGLAPYDARLRLSAPLPLVVARVQDGAAAREVLGLLQARGHGAVAFEQARAPSDERCFVAARLELRPEGLVAFDRAQAQAVLAYDRIVALIRAVELNEHAQSIETERKRLAIGRALLTGGLVSKKTERSTRTEMSFDREQVAYVFRVEAPEPVVLREHGLRYGGLGDERGTTARDSFERVVALIRRGAPGALYDERLRVHKRRLDLVAVSGGKKDQTRSSSNAAANLLAAFVLVCAALQGQL